MIVHGKNIMFLNVGPSDKATYYGGELREDAGGNLAYISIAGEVPGFAKPQDAVAVRLLQRIIGKSQYKVYNIIC